RHRSGWRQRVCERRPLRELLGEAREIRMKRAPVELGVAQVERSERAAGGDVGERIRLAVAPRALVELARELRGALADLAPLAIDPFLALQHRRTAPRDDDRSVRVADAVGQRLPFLDGDALAGGLGNEPRHRTHEVYVLDDD